ncbi:MAG: hypothetical protein ACI841_004423 [Planctomycetota bacterium]|jgi:hypothetical protein
MSYQPHDSAAVFGRRFGWPKLVGGCAFGAVLALSLECAHASAQPVTDPSSATPTATDPLTPPKRRGARSRKASDARHMLALRGEANARAEFWTDAEFETNALEIAGQIEELVGHSFPEAVALEVVDRSTFVDRMRSEQERIVPSNEVHLRAQVAKLLGMLPGGYDLSELLDAIRSDARGGFYETATGSMIMLRGVAGPVARVVMASEFARAMTQQLFDASDSKEAPTNADRRLARKAVLTGNSLSVFGRWMERHLPPLAPLDYLLFDLQIGNAAYDDAPPYIWRPAEGLWRRGESFLRRTNVVEPRPSAMREADIARVLSNPPRSTEQLLHPVKYWKDARRDEPRDLSWHVGVLSDGWSVISRDTLGEMYLGIMTLAPEDRTLRGEASMLELLSTRYTTDAADGWDGDRYLLLEKEQAQLVSLVTVWDSPAEAREFQDAVIDLEPLISESKTGMEGSDPALAGFEVEYDGRDRVTINSWHGLSRVELESLLTELDCVEVEH